MTISRAREDKVAGRVFTPAPLADALAGWAIRAPTDAVLDLGVGEGAFLVAAARRLRALGANVSQIQANVFGMELNGRVFERAQDAAIAELGVRLTNVRSEDFYSAALPAVDAVIGNPPYVRRHYQERPDAERTAAGADRADRMIDTYCLFLLRSLTSIKAGGRLAVVVSASWLDMRYGQSLKNALLSRGWTIRLLLGFEGRVFSDALVKPLVVLAERIDSDHPVLFARFPTTLDLDALPTVIASVEGRSGSAMISSIYVPKRDLADSPFWSFYLKSPDVHQSITKLSPYVPLHTLADSRIGLQTFAKPFFILSREEASGWGVEPEYLEPVAVSPREVRGLVIADPGSVRHRLLVCDTPIELLAGTGVGRYVRSGMTARVQVRGTDRFVSGYHAAPRLQRAGREPWYNLKTEIHRRRRWPILVPRRTFKSYAVVENRARVVANEDFIEINPHVPSHVPALLAFLNSSFGEFLVRCHAFQYGGGVFNLNPGSVRAMLVPDLHAVSAPGLAALTEAWRVMCAVRKDERSRAELDSVVAEVLGIPLAIRTDTEGALARLVASTASSTVHHGGARRATGATIDE